MSFSPVMRTNGDEQTPTDNSEIMKRIQSLHGKVEALKNELKQTNARVSSLEGKKETLNSAGKTLIEENK